MKAIQIQIKAIAILVTHSPAKASPTMMSIFTSMGIELQRMKTSTNSLKRLMKQLTKPKKQLKKLRKRPRKLQKKLRNRLNSILTFASCADLIKQSFKLYLTNI